MISWVFGPAYLWVDLLVAGIGEVVLAAVLLYLIAALFNWFYDFNGAMRVYRQMKKSTRGGIK